MFESFQAWLEKPTTRGEWLVLLIFAFGISYNIHMLYERLTNYIDEKLSRKFDRNVEPPDSPG